MPPPPADAEAFLDDELGDHRYRSTINARSLHGALPLFWTEPRYKDRIDSFSSICPCNLVNLGSYGGPSSAV